MSKPPLAVRVGIAAFILSPTLTTSPSNPVFLLGKRLGSHGSGTYALPGGHLEFGESPEECAAREILEETGLEVKDVRFLTATNDVMGSEGKHYVTLFVVCRRVDEGVEARNLEREKCEGWGWVGWRELVAWVEENGERKVFLPLVNLVRQRPGVVPGLG